MSEDAARDSLLMSAFVKIPLQLLVLSTGVLVFVFYLFQTPPMLFNRVHDARVAAGPYAAEYASLEKQFDEAIALRQQAAERSDRDAFLTTDASVLAIRKRASDIVKLTTGDTRYTDVNYVFPTFITTRHADRPGGPDDRGDLRGGDVGQRRRAELAGDRRRSSTSTGGISSRTPPTRTT